MKKLITCLLIAGLTISLLSACGGKPKADTKRPLREEPKEPVTIGDLQKGSPAYAAAAYALQYEAMEAPEGIFDPEAVATRGQGALAVYRLCGSPKTKGRTRFADGKEDPAVSWCDENGILADITGTTFGTEEPMSRELLAGMLYRAAAYLGYEAETQEDLSAFLDGHNVTNAKAMAWAVEANLFPSLISDTRLQPGVAVSRLQLAQAIVAFGAQEEADVQAAQILAAQPARAASEIWPNHEAIARYIESVAKKNGAAAVQVAVVEKGVVTDAYAYGWATKQTEPMTEDHKLRLASISKVVIATTAMLLQEEGSVDIDRDVSEYWGMSVRNPNHPEKEITLRSMLTHTSTIVNAPTEVSRLYADVTAKFREGDFSRGIPGQIDYWTYNNYAYGVLGMTLELASDSHIDDILSRRLYRYMDIDAAFASGDVQDTAKLATIYMSGGQVGRSLKNQLGTHVDPKPGGNGEFFSGAMTASAVETAKLAALLAGDGTYEGVRLMEASSVEQMETVVSQPTSRGFYQGLALRYLPNVYGRKSIYYHTGSGYGVYNCFTYDPDTGDGVVVLTTGAAGNKDDNGVYEICAAITNHIFRMMQ